MSDILTVNPWGSLARFTQARIALGRAGTSQPTKPHLDFQFAHARARNAVHHVFDHAGIEAQLSERGFKPLSLNSAAETREIYLQRPDLGRQLSKASLATLSAIPDEDLQRDVALVIVDGLSSLAIEKNALPLFDHLLPQLMQRGLSLAPVSVVRQGRVAVGDQICMALQAKLLIVLIGERPGLSSPDSLGIYLTWNPDATSTNAERNCLSNIRNGGLDFPTAVHKLLYLIEQSFRRQLSGVDLKDETQAIPEKLSHENRSFLLE